MARPWGMPASAALALLALVVSACGAAAHASSVSPGDSCPKAGRSASPAAQGVLLLQTTQVAVHRTLSKLEVDQPLRDEVSPAEVRPASPAEVHQVSRDEVHQAAQGEVRQASRDKVYQATQGEVRQASQGEVHQATQGEVHQASLGWPVTGRRVGNGWCQADVPPSWWTLANQCGSGPALQLRVLTYNLFWWRLFVEQHGNGGSAGRLIASAARDHPFDVMGFQECDDVARVLRDAGMSGSYAAVQGGHAMAIAFRTTSWSLLASGHEDVAEDLPGKYCYGRRGVVWARLRHSSTGRTLFFLNHHGPLLLHSGGVCGGASVAYNILRTVGLNAQGGDVVSIVGDFNAGPDSETVRTLKGRIAEVNSGTVYQGADHIFANCGAVIRRENLGPGGSDHDAISATFQL